MAEKVCRLRVEREKRGLSQSALSHLANCNAASISRIEGGIEPPYPLRGQRIADAIGWDGPTGALFEFVEVGADD